MEINMTQIVAVVLGVMDGDPVAVGVYDLKASTVEEVMRDYREDYEGCEWVRDTDSGAWLLWDPENEENVFLLDIKEVK